MKDYVARNIETYEVMIPFFSPIFNSDSQSLFEKKRLDIFLQKFNKGAYVLDMACGIGKITKYLYDKGYKVIGCDLCENLLNFALKNNPQIPFILSDIRHFKSAFTFDAIILSYCLFHFKTEDIISILTNVKKILNKDGVIHIVTYIGRNQDGFIDDPINDDDYISRIVEKQRKGKKFQTYVHLLDEKEIIDIIKKSGYKIIDKEIFYTTKKGIGFSEKILFLDIQI